MVGKKSKQEIEWEEKRERKKSRELEMQESCKVVRVCCEKNCCLFEFVGLRSPKKRKEVQNTS